MMEPSPAKRSPEGSLFTPDELAQWRASLSEANRTNIFCHCRQCDREWIASTEETCVCGSRSVQHIACWQFPDD
ncbi:hypothetical protein [Vacuolonema iberomarrocanum]|uniref:hypothetical protein n=1 Tax=Vacuolonema iberomarrocanum TaxID=3454632 RepID=UPI003F6E0ABE